MRLQTIKFLALIGLIASLFALSPLALAQTTKPTNTPKPTNTAKPTLTPKPTNTPKPPFESCRLYPSATPRKNVTPSKVPDEASTSLIVPTSTLLSPTATPAAVDNPTNIPVGIAPADALLQLRQSPLYQRAGKACVMVYEVVPGGPAALAGIRANDLILGIEKTQITDIGEFYAEIVKRASGDVVKITLQRGEEQLAVSVTLGLSAFGDPNAMARPSATATKPKK